MARGRDAVDVALTTSFGKTALKKFTVWTDEVSEAPCMSLRPTSRVRSFYPQHVPETTVFGSGEQVRHRLGLDQLARLVQVVVDDRVRVDADGVVDRRQQLAGMDRVLERGRSRSCRTCRGRSRA